MISGQFFPDSLSEQRLFDLWVERHDQPGWQGESAKELGKSASWISLRLTSYRDRLTDDFQIHDEDAFLDVLRSFQVEDEDNQPQPVTEDGEAENEPGDGIQANRGEVLRQRLFQHYEEGSQERLFMDDLEAGELTEEQIHARYPNENDLLDRLHKAYRGLGKQLQTEEQKPGS